MAHISIRKSIRWLPDDASEPTSTIVLSSAQRRFVDLRILKPEAGESQPRREQHLDVGQLDWAIAGTSSSVETSPGVTLSTFHHWIDSRTLDAEAATDAGYMTPMDPDGEKRLVLETGNMINPESGLPTDYEEVWIEEELEPVPGDEGSQVVVLDFDQGAEHRGRVVRVGTRCQGLLRCGDQVSIERWEWNEEERWTRSHLIGRDGALPCKKLLDSVVGDTIEYEGNTWVVVERK